MRSRDPLRTLCGALDFLLECIGFPPDHDLDALTEVVRTRGEGVAWRGDPERHRRLPLGGGLELRADQELPGGPWTLLPYYQVTHRLRVAVESLRAVPDSPFDALLVGWADPAAASERDPRRPGAYRLACYITDARRLPRTLLRGHVLAVSIAGFALDVSYVGPNAGAARRSALDAPLEAEITPLGDVGDPGGCSEVSLRIESLRHLVNPLTGAQVELIEARAPGRPLQLFASRWQLEHDGLPPPRPGWRIEGTFLFSGRIAGGLAGERRRAGDAFG